MDAKDAATDPQVETKSLDERSNASINISQDFIRDPLLKYLNPNNIQTQLFDIQEAIHALKTDGYYHIPAVFTTQECNDAIDQIWEFVQDVSAGVVRREDVRTWYSMEDVQIVGDGLVGGEKENVEEMPSGRDMDPWPHTGYSSFPDMFQSLGAGKCFVAIHHRFYNV